VLLFKNGRHEGALLCFLVAIAATSRKRYPPRTPSRRHPGKDMRDGEAFETFFDEARRQTSPIMVGMMVSHDGNSESIEHLFYKFMRSTLVHEGALPRSVELVFEGEANTVSIQAGPAGSPVRVGLGWLGQLIEMVAQAPENSAEFADVLTKCA
jgi:hypothetical protein